LKFFTPDFNAKDAEAFAEGAESRQSLSAFLCENLRGLCVASANRNTITDGTFR